jgi:hypothetical protein
MKTNIINDLEPSEDLSPERPIYLKESDFEFLIELLEPLEKKCKGNAEKCRSFYGSAASDEKRDFWIERSERIRSLIIKMGEVYI